MTRPAMFPLSTSLRMRRRPSDSRRGARGSAMVELAIVAVPLLSIGLLAFDVGRAMYTYSQLLKAARDGARFLSAFDPDNPQLYPVQQTINRVVYGKAAPAASDTPMIRGLTPSMVQVCDRVSVNGCAGNSYTMTESSPQNGKVSMVRVQITGYAFRPMIPGVSRLLPMTFDDIGATMRQVQ